MQMQSQILQALLTRLEPYLNEDIANELIFVEEKEFFIEKNGKYQKIRDEKLDFNFLYDFCIQLANQRKMPFNEFYPSLSCSIPNTRFRIQALHQSITKNSQINLNIRIPSSKKFPIQSFKIGDKCNFSYQEILDLVRNAKNILISGGTASGKTSFLNTIIEEIPLDERIVTIEDSPELYLLHENKTQILVSKNDNSRYSYEQALNSAMRLSPQRLLLGEIDTKNVMLFLRLGNTGHSGMISTIHSDSVVDAVKAVSLNIKMSAGSKDIDTESIEDYFKTAVDYIIQIKKVGSERIIYEIQSTMDLIK